jgi:nucleotide-binding universal stress UspA family protein
MTIKSVLVPVDFSPPSILALNYGVSLARQFHAQLILLHVLSGGLNGEQQDQVTCALSMLVSPEDQDDLNLLVLVKSGSVEHQIEAAVSDYGVGAIVMGTHGRRLIGRLLIGSVTESLLRKSAVPVMTVCHTIRPLELKHILFATDLTPSANAAFGAVLDLARTASGSVVLLHVTAPPVQFYDRAETMSIAEQAQRDYRSEMRERMDRLIAQAHREGIPCEGSLRDGDPASIVLQEAQNRCSDLIVVAVAERGAIDRALFGSTAERVIREAQIPVFCIHIPKPEQEMREDTQIVGHWERD